MSAAPAIYAARQAQDVAELTRSHPLAWLVSLGAAGLQASALPLLAHVDGDGRISSVEGHFARSNPQVAALRANPQALLLWLGPQGYVSPSWMTDRTQAPTWNYASLQCPVRVELIEDEGALRTHLDALVATHEAGRACPWQAAEMGARYSTLAARIVAFRATPTAADSQRERFKLGQDERDDVYADILTGLARSPGQAELCDWMRRSNPGRPERDTN